ncbi:MAG TPA: DUF4214 domain-containing protein [Pirellulales bacterium]|nr:DUF4214 domain-containing protein [Pirellulales bacterium]
MESLEDRRLLTWISTFVQSTGTLTVQGQSLSSDTGVLKVDPNSGEILLDGNNSGNFVDTGANLATISAPIQIQGNTTINSNFIIDNNAGAFFEAPATFLAPTGYPAKALFNYTGSTAFEPNSSLTIRGRAGVADTFTVTPDATFQDTGVVTLTEPPNQLNQQNSLTVTYGYLPVAGSAANINATPGISGHLNLDGVDGTGGNDKLIINDPTGVASDWTLNGNEIAGPAFPAAATVPPTPPPLPGTIGDITFANMANLQFNNAQAGDLLTINATAAKTTATTKGTTVVNYSQPLAFPVNLIGTVQTGGGSGGNNTGGILDIVGAAGGNNDFYIDDQSVSLATANTHPQYGTPFTHLGADLTYTPGTLTELQVAGNGGNNTVTVQVPPTLFPGFKSQTLPATFVVYGGALPPPAQLAALGVLPTPVTLGTNLLRVFGNAPGSLTSGSDNITVSDFGGTTNTGGGTTGGANIEMSRISAVVIYGEGGNDTLTNSSAGIPAQGILPVSALLIGGSGNDTLTGGAGNDMLLGGGGQDTLTSNAAGTATSPTTTYFFPHQDQFGNIYDPFLTGGDTTSTITGAGLGNEVVVTGVIGTANSGTGSVGPSDQDLGSLTSATFPPGISGGPFLGTATVDLVPTVPASNVTAPLYEATPALLALEQAIGEGSGQFPANQAAVLEFGGQLNLRGQFGTFAAFVGRAYDDFLVDRGGGGTFGGSNTGLTFASGAGSSIVSNQEIQYWAAQGQAGLSVQQMQSQLLASNELRQTLPSADQWVRFLYDSVLGRDPTSAELTAFESVLNRGDTGAARYALALTVLMSPAGQTAEIKDIYFNVVPGSPSPSSTDLTAVQADLASGESLTQIAQTVSASQGNYLSYELANHVGTVGFVAGVYQSVLHRAASSADLTYWASVRGAGVSDAQIAQIILSSPEARSFLIESAYESYLGRPVDAGGLSYWEAVLASGQISDEQFVASIIASPEYYARNGSTSQSYVRALYHDLLGRTSPPPQQEIDFWVSQLAMSTRGAVQARADIAVAFEQSTEYRTDLINHWYQIYDGRAPTASELNSALGLLQSGASDEYVQAQILVARQGS